MGVVAVRTYDIQLCFGQSQMPDGISRRTFLGLIAAGLTALVLFAVRRIDVPNSIRLFFGLEQDLVPVIRSMMQRLQKTNAPLFQKTLLFFTLSRFGAHRLLSKRTQLSVLTYWCQAFFSNRALAWPYIHYPDVGNSFICNGLIQHQP
jgi:hypothetical protein